MDRVKLIIVDDDLIACSILQNFFAPLTDIQVLGEAHDGTELMHLLEDTAPDVILLDMIMPVMDGFSVLQALQKLPPERSPTVIVQTAMGNDSFIARLRPFNVYHYMLKPYSLDVLRERILDAMHDRRAPDPRYGRGNVDNWIRNTLCALGMPPNFAGYSMLLVGIKLCLEDHKRLQSATKSLYPMVAASTGSSVEKVERNMRHAIRTAWQRSGVTAFRQVLGYNVTPQQLTVTEFIALMAERLQQGGYYWGQDAITPLPCANPSVQPKVPSASPTVK